MSRNDRIVLDHERNIDGKYLLLLNPNRSIEISWDGLLRFSGVQNHAIDATGTETVTIGATAVNVKVAESIEAVAQMIDEIDRIAF